MTILVCRATHSKPDIGQNNFTIAYTHWQETSVISITGNTKIYFRFYQFIRECYSNVQRETHYQIVGDIIRKINYVDILYNLIDCVCIIK